MTVVRVPLRRVVRMNSCVLDEDTDPEFAFKYIDISQVDGNGVVSVPDELTTFESAPSRARRQGRPGDVVVSTVRTYLRAIGSIPHAEDPLVFSTGFSILEAGHRVDPRFLVYACREDGFVSQVEARSTGLSYPAINPSELASIPVPMPPLEEQRRIADFLDDLVDRIDTVVSLRQRQAELERAAFSSWLSDTVSALPRVPLRRQMASVTSGPRGWGDLVDDAGSRMFIRINNISGRGIEPSLEGVARVNPPTDAEAARAQLATGDVLVSITASIGDVAVAGPELEGAAFSQHVARVRLLNPDVARAVAWAASASVSRDELLDSAAGGTKIGLGLQQVSDWKLPVFGTDAASFAQACDDRHGASTQILAMMEGVIRTLGEYKRSLITAAVTGEMDVTTARPGVPA